MGSMPCSWQIVFQNEAAIWLPAWPMEMTIVLLTFILDFQLSVCFIAIKKNRKNCSQFRKSSSKRVIRTAKTVLSLPFQD
jgi:hypothetical protein